MIAPLVALLQLAAAQDSLPRVMLEEARARAARLDPAAVAAAGAVDNAQWARRSAYYALVTPSVVSGVDASRFSTPAFNLGTGQLDDVAVTARLSASYDLFAGGRKVAELARSRAELARAQADEVQARFAVGLATERDYYQVLADQELARVARERVTRAEEQLVIARARVVSGAAVSTDSLQLRLELNRARVALLRQEASLRVARLQLGRRVGLDGPVAAAPLDTGPPGAPDAARGAGAAPSAGRDLPITLEQAVAEARQRGPAFVAARAAEDAGDAAVRAQRAFYLPSLTLGAQTAGFDNRFFPDATARSSVTVSLNFPLWNAGQRELLLAQARARRDLARAARLDRERGVARDVTESYEAYATARAATALAQEAILVARENYRVQDTRYRAGAATILELLEAQLRLVEAEAELVQSRYAVRLAVAALEAILGRRL
jgi:outer membrane protein